MRLIFQVGTETGALPVRWCLTEEDRMLIERDRLSSLYVIIDIVYENDMHQPLWMTKVRDRILVPAEECMHYLTFRRPGMAYVCAALIHISRTRYTEPQVHTILRKLQKRDGGVFEERVFNFAIPAEDDPLDIQIDHESSDSSEYETLSLTIDRIEVSPEHFGKPLTGWMKWWVEWFPREFLRRSLIDECDQRKWKLFAFSVQLIIFPLCVLAYIILFVFSVFSSSTIACYLGIWRGYRGIDMETVIDTLGSPKEMFKIVNDRGWSSRYEEDATGHTLPFFYRFIQPATILIGGAFALFNSTEQVEIRWLALFLGFIGAIGLYPTLRHWVRNWQWSSEHAYKRRLKERREKEASQAAEKAAQAEHVRLLLEDLACPKTTTQSVLPDSGKSMLATIPARRRTIRHYFQAFKAIACKPLPR